MPLYIKEYRERNRRELAYFQSLPDVDAAIQRAALAQKPNGKKFRHQARIPKPVLRESANRLLKPKAALVRCRTFEDLLSIVSKKIGGLRGVGELTIYDTSLRIGAKLGLLPNLVFLHAGTRAGAKALGLGHVREALPLNAFPRELKKLKPHEIEDFLCIFKTELRRLKIGDESN